MSTYITVGSRGPVTGAADTTGNNPGNWTVTFDPSILSVNVPYFECYKIIIAGAAGSSFSVYIDQNQWDTTQQGYLNSWEPSSGFMVLRPGDTIYFYWNDPVTDNTPPVVTLYLRYDQDIWANQSYANAGGAVT